MAKKQILDKNVKEISASLKKDNLIIGTERTMKLIRNNAISKVFMTSNCPKTVKDDLEHYKKISNFELVPLTQNNEDLGSICKKQFNISIVSLRKGEA